MASYREWIKLLDIDYYTAFLKSWIAFNSWYKNRPEYQAFSQDRQIIDEIKSNNSSIFKRHIVNLISGSDFESKSFGQDIGNLHLALSQATLFIHNGNNPSEPISFENIAINNQTKQQSQATNGIKYNLERIKGGEVKLEIKTMSTPPIKLLESTQTAYNELALETSADFINLTDDQKQTCISLYRNINPYTYYSIICKGKAPNKLKLGDVVFINDIDKISIAIIEILFMLRNTLVHGSVEPNDNNNRVYKYAYSLLHTVLTKM